jgi:hypothetical protein
VVVLTPVIRHEAEVDARLVGELQRPALAVRPPPHDGERGYEAQHLEVAL